MAELTAVHTSDGDLLAWRATNLPTRFTAGRWGIGLAGGDAVPEMLQALPVDQRAAVMGRVLQERDYDELAASLECSPSVARQRVSRGLKALRSRLEQTP